jgi:hypothetical protein
VHFNAKAEQVKAQSISGEAEQENQGEISDEMNEGDEADET